MTQRSQRARGGGGTVLVCALIGQATQTNLLINLESRGEAKREGVVRVRGHRNQRERKGQAKRDENTKEVGKARC